MEIQETKTVVLRTPFQFGEQTIAEVNLREPTAGDLILVSKCASNLEAAAMLVGLASDIGPAAAKKLGQRDFQECNDFLASFSTGGQSTGETS
jgi:hypothetical protein